MPRGSTLALAVLAFVLLAAASCARASDAKVYIRIRNDTPLDIKGFWLGTGSGAGGPASRAYGAIAAGETTRYRDRKAQYGYYSNYNLVTTDGARFMDTFPADRFGAATLDPGYYTFVFHDVDGQYLLDVIRDTPPD